MAYSKEEAANLIIQAGLELVKHGLIVRTWGNISARISDMQFMITPSGRSYDTLTEKDIVTVNISDYTYEGENLPSGEKDLHGGVYKNRPDVNFIIHTHQLYGTAYGSAGQMLTGYDDNDKEFLGEKVVCVDYAPSCSKKLAQNMSTAAAEYSECYGFFMKYHGVLCLGKDIEQAFFVSAAIEDICMHKVTGKLKFALEGKEGKEIVITEQICAKFPGKKVMFVSSPAIVAISEKFLKLRPTIDDLAQIGGVNINCIDYYDDFEFAIKKAVGKNNVVLVRKCGAIVVADTFEDCQAIGIVLDKNCTALLFEMILGPAHHMKLFDALAQRRMYVNKYSKLKNVKKPEPVNNEEAAREEVVDEDIVNEDDVMEPEDIRDEIETDDDLEDAEVDEASEDEDDREDDES